MATLKSIEIWTAHIEAARRHPGGVKGYCDGNGITSNLYYQWFKRLKPEHPEWHTPLPPKRPRSQPQAAEFLSVKVITEQPKNLERLAVEIRMPNGVVVVLPEGMSVQQLAAVMLLTEVKQC